MSESLIIWLAKIPLFPILPVISLTGLFIGIFFIVKPALAIEIQRRFYAKINWRIEPISVSREVRNTRIMGYFLVIFSLMTLTFILSDKSVFFLGSNQYRQEGETKK